jgi:hypothetical protein
MKHCRVCMVAVLSVVLLLAWAPLAEACRLLFVLQTLPNAEASMPYFTTHSRSLLSQSRVTLPVYQLAGQSTEINARAVHASTDGVGLAFFQAQSASQSQLALVYKQVEPLGSTSAAYQQTLANLLPQSHAILGHIREATRGSVKPENTHPFSFNLQPHEGGTWAVAANGTVSLSETQYQRWVRDARLKRPHLPENDSDALGQILLQALVDAVPKLASPSPSLSPLSNDAVVQAVLQQFNRVLAKQPRKTFSPFNAATQIDGGGGDATTNARPASGHPPSLGSVTTTHPASRYPYVAHQNVILTNGSSALVVVHEHPMWYRFEYAATASPSLVASVGPVAMVFASEPTDIAEYYGRHQQQYPSTQSRWQQIPNNTALRVLRTSHGLDVRWYPL